MSLRVFVFVCVRLHVFVRACVVFAVSVCCYRFPVILMFIYVFVCCVVMFCVLVTLVCALRCVWLGLFCFA